MLHFYSKSQKKNKKLSIKIHMKSVTIRKLEYVRKYMKETLEVLKRQLTLFSTLYLSLLFAKTKLAFGSACRCFL